MPVLMACGSTGQVADHLLPEGLSRMCKTGRTLQEDSARFAVPCSKLAVFSVFFEGWQRFVKPSYGGNSLYRGFEPALRIAHGLGSITLELV